MSAAIKTATERMAPGAPAHDIIPCMLEEINDLRAALADRQVAAPVELMPDLDLAAFENAIRNLGLIEKGLALSKDHDLDSGHVTATIKHAKAMAKAVLPRLNAAYGDLVTTLRSARAAARHAATPPLCPECQAREAGADPIGDLQRDAKDAKLREFIAETRDPGAATQPPLRLALPDHEREDWSPN